MRLPLALIGFTSMIAQVVLLREIIATFYGNELMFGVVLASWLVWVAAGAWGLYHLLPNQRYGIGAFAAGLMLMALAFPLQITVVRTLRSLLNVTPGAFVEFGQMVTSVTLCLAPLCLLCGYLFTLGTRLTSLRGGQAGSAYAWESAGSVAGGLLFSFILIHSLNPYQIALLVGVILLAGACWLWFCSYAGKCARISLYVAITCLPLAVLVYAAGGYLHNTTLDRQWKDLVFAADSPYGRLTIQARESQRVFYENGLLTFETQGTFAEEVVHFPLLTHPDPRDVLLIGGGIAGDLNEILKHPVTRVSYVELDPLVIQAAREYLPAKEAQVLADPRVETILSDGRLYVKQCLQDQDNCTFDAVILDLPEPSTGALNRFYTREFFAEVQQILNQNGLLSLGLPSAENYWSPEMARRNASIYYSLRAVFPHVVVLPGEHIFFLASREPLESDPLLLIARIASRGIENRWVTPAYLNYIYTTDRYKSTKQILDEMSGVRLNEDLKPISYYYDLALWMSLFYPKLRAAFEEASFINLWWITLPLGFILVLTRWRRNWAIPFVIAGIGFAQMTLEVVILFTFQVLYGYVYAQASLIITAFMAGLALGAGFSNWLLSSTYKNVRNRLNKKRALVGIQVMVVCFSAVFPLLIKSQWSYPDLVFSLMTLLAGTMTGAAFPLALALLKGAPSQLAGRLYGMDLLGGSVGALLGAVFLIPILGIPQTCVLIAIAGVTGLFALI